jgi:NADP-dependent 3-hydroxy acid dehydrogenase YdfG
MASTLGGTAALVTGASSGIGAATARQLAEQGAAVALVARRKDRLDTLVADIEQAGGTALAVEADISDRTQAEAAVQQAAERFGRLDTLVNNAGLMLLGPIVGADPEEWDRMTAVNVEGLLYSTRAALPHLLRADYAAGLYRATRPGGRWHLYCFSGGNINGMTAPWEPRRWLSRPCCKVSEPSRRTFATHSPPTAG